VKVVESLPQFYRVRNKPMTSTVLVQREVSRFLSTKEPEVLCITGDWGVGKTFIWQTTLNEAVKGRTVELARYSYVSLFGLNSLEAVKLATFENLELVVPNTEAELGAKAKDLGNKAFSAVAKFRGVAGGLPWLGKALSEAGPLFFSAVREQLVCIDDLERRGDNLSIRDVLGLVSFLKEQRRCKVILLLNEQAFDKDEANEFNNYFEKVVDIALKLAPLPKDSVGIALPDSDATSQLIAANCITLGISNIRIIRKILRLARIVEPILSSFDPKVIRQAIQTLTLFAWSKYQPDSAPDMSFLKKKREVNYFGLGEPDDVPADEAAWNALLRSYGFSWIDDFDEDLIGGIENGFFDLEKVTARATELNLRIELERKNGSFSDAWRTYHDSFDSNADEVLDTVSASFITNVHSVSPLNLNGTVTLFKELGSPQRAAQLLSYYLAERNEPREFWNLSEHAFPFEISDPDVISAFNERYKSLEDKIELKPTLLKIARRDSWNPRELEAVASYPPSDYYRIFKEAKGPELADMISGALQFSRVVDATSSMRAIAASAREALLRIGQESKINALRIRKLGIAVD
jgi:hypothetical protein